MELEFVFSNHHATDLWQEAHEFYRSCGKHVVLDKKDLLVIARFNDNLAAMARLCQENGVAVHRDTQVRDDLVHIGLGKKLLQEFVVLLKQQKITLCYCVAHKHLEAFYGTVGFKKIPSTEAPDFLRDQMAELRKTPKTEPIVLVLR